MQISAPSRMPQRYPSAKDLADELFRALQRQPNTVDRWIPAVCIEHVIYPELCVDLGWPPRPWRGRKGVAAHLGKHAQTRYHWIEIDGVVQNRLHYWIASPGNVVSISGRRS